MLRTHTCGELNKENVEKEVILCGWVSSRRDHGKIIFIDLRDRYGITQIVFFPKPHPETYTRAKKLKNEDVIKIKGKVNLRPPKTINPKLPTGEIEIAVEDLEILSSSKDLPFSIEEKITLAEEVRFKYRYLDLRRKEVLDRFILRHKLNQHFRIFLNRNNFLEIETPYLAKSTPEGARDFLVPSRLNPGSFYALPQSPQLFKQLLMVAGIDKYYQLVRCFRDEDLRRDRQPEFTQLDIEASFIEEGDIFSLCEEMLKYVFKEVMGRDLKTPFPRISYQKAIGEYNTDKPDIGEGDFRFLWVVDFPLFEYNSDSGLWQSCHHPFTAPREEDIEFLDKDLSKIRARAYDLVLNGEEIASGSIRIHSASLQEKIFEILGITKEVAEENFGFLLNAFDYGVPPHGGIAFGLDRFYAILTNSESIREIIAFPKTQKGICLLTGAPALVDEAQLKELSLATTEARRVPPL